MLKVGQVVELEDNKEYMVLEKIKLHNISYVYLITVAKPVEILIATESKVNDEYILEEIKDNDELDYVMSQFILTKETE